MNKQIAIPATYMRGGTSKGVFFSLDDLPAAAREPGIVRDQLLQRVIGGPDPYKAQIDGMGGATSSTSKVVIVSRSEREGHDVDYLFGQVSIDQPMIDWSGNCGNLSAAVGPFALHAGLIDPQLVPDDGHVQVRIWQANIGKTILVDVPVCDSQVKELGDFFLDGVTFAAAELKVSFVAPNDDDEKLFPTGQLIDELEVPGVGTFNATLISAGIPTIFIDAESMGLSGIESQAQVNSDTELLDRFERIRAYGACQMGLITDLEEAKQRQHTPKVAFVSPAQDYVSSSGKTVMKQDYQLSVRALSMGKLHHAMMGTAAVAIASAAAIPGTVVNRAAGGESRQRIVFGHPSGTLAVGAQSSQENGTWQIKAVTMSRSARVLMEGAVRVPQHLTK